MQQGTDRDVTGLGASSAETAERPSPQDRASDSRHGPIAQLLIALAPLSVILVVYGLAEWISDPLGTGGGARSNRLGFPVHVTGPARADSAVFGTVPSVWLQQHLVDGSAHWYDAVAALVYSTHFVSIPLVTGITWFCLRDRFRAWLAVVLTFTTLGMSGYVVYPATPPWLASERGAVGPVQRISDLGWGYLHLDWVGALTASGQGESNPVAAMPSLHAGSALVVTLFLWPVVSAGWRTVLLAYAVLMALTLVYTGEHYAVDVLVGWLTAAAAVAVGSVLGPGRHDHAGSVRAAGDHRPRGRRRPR
jgi:membrane-associated phospholipid phosphatase